MSDQIIDLTEPVMPASSETVREARSAGGAAGHAAAELALAAVNHRLDRLVASGADGGDVGTELRDIRVMRDGTAASTAGGAVRTQVDAAKQANGQLSLASLDFDGIGSRYMCDNLTMHRHKILNQEISCKGEPLDDAVLEDAKFASISDPVLVRAADGNPIIRNLTITGASSTDAICAVYWDKNGEQVGKLPLNDLGAAPDHLIIPSAVWMSFVEYDNYPQCRWRLASRTVEWLNAGVGGAEYTVGADGDWQSLTECLHALKDDRHEKTIRVMPGEYDIFEELGGAGKWSSYAGSDNWRDVQPVVPPNTRLTGVGRVVLRMTPAVGEISAKAAALLSPLNVSGSCTIENLEIVAGNCRYAVHDECSGREEFAGATHTFRHVTASRAAHTLGYGQTFGCGEARNGTYLYEDCVITGDNPYTIHTNKNSASDRTTLTFRHCLIGGAAGSAGVGLSTSWDNKAENLAVFDSCRVGGIRTYNEQSDSQLNSYRIRLMGCNADAAITHSNKNTLDPQVVNPIPVTGGTAMNDTTNTTAAIGGGLSLPSLAHAARRIDWTVAA